MSRQIFPGSNSIRVHWRAFAVDLSSYLGSGAGARQQAARALQRKAQLVLMADANPGPPQVLKLRQKVSELLVGGSGVEGVLSHLHRVRKSLLFHEQINIAVNTLGTCRIDFIRDC